MTIIHPDTTAEYPEINKRVNGVFKGGGAKGLVYAGALHEVRARGIWFESVAGASAGAITAMLVAADYDPIEILKCAPEALQQVKKNWVKWLGNVERSVFVTDGLHKWIEDRLRAKFPDSHPEGAITFGQLHELGFGIELNVIAMDLARNEPIVFNWSITPDFSVAEAVVASSAIPVAMPSRRVLIRRPGRPNQIHRLVDGGTWANYPAFVYKDPSLRSYFGLPELSNSDTLGFVIESQEYGAELEWLPTADRYTPPEGWRWPAVAPEASSGTAETVVAVAQRRSRYDRGSARRMGYAGAVLTWAGLRWLLLALIAIGVFALTGNWAASVLAGDPLDLPDPYQRAGTVLYFIAVTIVFWISVGIIAGTIRFGAEAVDAGLPSLLAATSASTGVARWVGHSPSDPVIRLSAPMKISVVGFSVRPVLQWLAVVVAASQTADQLERLFPTLRRSTSVISLEHLPNGLGEAESAFIDESRKNPREVSKKPSSTVLFFGVFWALLLVALAWVWPGLLLIALAGLVGIPVTGSGAYLLFRWMVPKNPMTSDRPSRPKRLLRIVAAVLLVALVVVAFWAILLVALTWTPPGVFAIVFSLLIGFPATAYGVVHLLKGRRYNQSMTSDLPSPPNPMWRFVPAAILVAFGFAVLGNPQSVDSGEILEQGGLAIGQIYELAAGIALIIGIGCAVSGASRISAIFAARRYNRQIRDGES